MSNPRDLIKLQNQLWWKREQWNDGTVPSLTEWGFKYDSSGDPDSAVKNRPYWGWNEIPVSRAMVSDIANWDAIMIKLPADACLQDNGRKDRLSCYDKKYHTPLEKSIENFVNGGKLGVGKNVHPSSNLVLAREYMDDSGNYFREFFCEHWVSPSGKYQIRFKRHRHHDDVDDVHNQEGDHCFLDLNSDDVQV